MAVDVAGLQINITAGDSASNISAISKSLTELGSTGDAAVQKLASAGQKAAAGLRPVGEAAKAMSATVTDAFAKAGSVNIGSSGVTAFAAQMDKAQVAVKAVAESTATAEPVIRDFATAVTRSSVSAEESAAALAAWRAEMGMSTSATTSATRATMGWAEVQGDLGIKMGSLTKAAMDQAAGLSAEEKAANAAKNQAAALAAEEKSAASATEKLASEMQKTSGHATGMARNIGLAERGAHDLLSVFGLASGPANMVGKLARGVDDLMLSVARGGAGMLAFSGGMAAFSIAMKLASDAMGTMAAGFDAAGKEEGLNVQFTNLLGSSKAASAQLDQIKEFVTGGAGGFLKFDDVAAGVKQFESLNNVTSVTNAQMTTIAGAAAVAGISFSKAADEYGKVTNQIKLQLPVRAATLVTMQQEGIISAGTVSKIENLAKAHAGAAAELKALDEGMKSNAATAAQMTGTYNGLMNQIQQTFTEDVIEPFGSAFEEAIKPALEMFENFLKGQSGNIAAMAHALQVNLLTAILYVKEVGFGQALQDGLNALGQFIESNIAGAFISAVNGFNGAMVALFVMMETRWFTVLGNVFKFLGDSWNTFVANIPAIEQTIQTAFGNAMMFLAQKWDDFTSGIPGVEQWVTAAFTNAMDWLTKAWNDFVNNVVPAIGQAIQDAFSKAMGFLSDAWNKFWGKTTELQAGPTGTPAQQPGQPTGLGGLGGGPETGPGSGSELRDYFEQAQQPQTDATKEQTDVTKQQTDVTKQQTTAAQQQTTALQQLPTQLSTILQQGMAAMQSTAAGGFGLGTGGLPSGDQGGIRIMSEWAPGEQKTRANQVGPMNNQLQLGDVAVSTDLMQQFNLKLGDYIDIIGKSGQVIAAHQHVMDTSWISPGVQTHGVEMWGVQDPNLRANIRKSGVPSAGAMGAAQAQADVYKAGGAYATGTGVGGAAETPAQRWERLKAEAEKMSQGGAAGAAKLGGPAAQVTGKAPKTGLTEEKKLTDELNDAEKRYGEQIKLVEAQKKAGLISSQAAINQELSLYKQEQSALENIKSKLQAAEAAAIKANDTKGAEAYHEKLVSVDTKLADILEKEKELGAQTFGGQFAAQMQKNADSMQLTGAKAADALGSAFSTVGDGLTSIIDGTAKASDAFKTMAKSIIDQLMKIAEQMAISQIFKLLSSSMGGAGGATGSIVSSLASMASSSGGGMQTGGLVEGPQGTHRVPIMATAGEFVLSKDAVKHLGPSTVAALNAAHKFTNGGLIGYADGGIIRGYQGGGLVSQQNALNAPPSAKAGAGQPMTVATNITVAGSSTGGGTGSGSMTPQQAQQFQSMLEQQTLTLIQREKRPGGTLNPNSR